MIIDVIKYARKQIVVSVIFYFLGILLGVLLFWSKSLDFNHTYNTWITIFINNLKVAMMIIIIGLITFGIGNSIMLVMNGCILGSVIKSLINLKMESAIITGLFPHMFLEIIGLILCSAISYESLILVRQMALNKKGVIVHIGHDLKLLVIGISFLFIASIIEAYISYF